MPANAMMDLLSILFRVFYRVELKGVENLDRRRAKPDHRAQPHELPRRRAGAVAAAEGPGVRHRQRDGAALVGEAVPALHPRHAARSDQADGDAHA